MYIETVPNRNSPPAILLRESYRDGGKIKKRTIANLSHWPTEIVPAPAEQLLFGFLQSDSAILHTINTSGCYQK